MATVDFNKLTEEQIEMWDYKPPRVRFYRLKRRIAKLLLPIVRWCDPDWLD